MSKYQECRYHVPGTLADIKAGKLKHFCAPDAKTLGESWEQKVEIDKENCESCQNFKSRYIQYPLEVSNIVIKQPEAWNISFTPVKVRLCEDNKTYFGILLGDFPWLTHVSHNEDTKVLNISTTTNPLIILPEQKRLVFGCESWWQRIEPGEDISDITNEEIDAQWYIQFLKGLGEAMNEAESQEEQDDMQLE